MVDRPCRALDVAETHGVAAVLVERTDFGADFDRDGLHRRGGRRARTSHDIDLVAMAGFGTILAEGDPRRVPGRILNTHPSLLPAFPGWHAVRDALDARGRRSRAAPCTSATEEVDAGPILAQEAVPVLPGDTEETLHERIKAVERRLYPAPSAASSQTSCRDGPRMRALLSVYDKTGMVELARALVDLGWELVSSGGTAAAPGRGRARRSPTSPTSPASRRCSATGWSRCTRRSTAAILADRDDPTHVADIEPARHRADRPRRRPTSTRSDRDPSIELIDIGGPAMVRAAAKNHAHVGDGRRPRRLRRRARRAAGEGALSDDDPAPSGPQGVRPHRGLRRGHRGVVRRRRRRDAAADHPPRPRARAGPALRREPAPGRRPLPDDRARTRGGTTSTSTRDGAVATSTSTTPTRRGARRTTSATDAGRAPSSSTPTRAASRWPTTWPTAYQRAYECDERSAFGGIVALNRPVDDATVERMVAGRPGRRGHRARLRRRRGRRAAGQAEEHPGPRGAPPPTPSRSAPPDHRRRSSCRRPPTSPSAGPTGGSSPSASPPRRSGPTPSSPGGSSAVAAASTPREWTCCCCSAARSSKRWSGSRSR